MSIATTTTFLALLTVLCLIFIGVVAVLAVVSKLRGGLPESLDGLAEGVAQLAIPMAFLVALGCTLGSLYMSEVAKFPPCELCWYQRICMYPLTVLLLVAWIRGRDLSVRWYVWPLAAIGFGIATYHYLLERFPTTVTFSCASDVPCSTVWIWKFHFLSIPAMAWVGFLTISVLLGIGAARNRSTPSERLNEATAPNSDEPSATVSEVTDRELNS